MIKLRQFIFRSAALIPILTCRVMSLYSQNIWTILVGSKSIINESIKACYIIQFLWVCKAKYFFLWPKHLSVHVWNFSLYRFHTFPDQKCEIPHLFFFILIENLDLPCISILAIDPVSAWTLSQLASISSPSAPQPAWSDAAPPFK